MADWLDIPFAAWRETVATADDPPAASQGLFEAWVRQQLDAHPDADRDGVRWDRRIGELFLDLDAAVERRGWVEHGADDERAVRRWCWAMGWHLMSQDEDLLLMGPDYDPWLLGEAARGCAKRNYAVSIVVHSLRDALHHALWPRDQDTVRGWAGTPGSADVQATVQQQLDRASALVRQARATGDEQALTYIERLASYATASEVDEAQARQRVFDLRRCSPRPKRPVRLRRSGHEWIGSLKLANTRAGELHIDARTGRMWAVFASAESGPRPAEKKKKRGR